MSEYIRKIIAGGAGSCYSAVLAGLLAAYPLLCFSVVAGELANTGTDEVNLPDYGLDVELPAAEPNFLNSQKSSPISQEQSSAGKADEPTNQPDAAVGSGADNNDKDNNRRRRRPGGGELRREGREATGNGRHRSEDSDNDDPEKKKMVVSMQNISLKSCIEILAQQLKLEYLIAPNIKTDKLISVRVGDLDSWSMADKEKLLDAILNMSGVQRVKRGEVWIFRPFTGEASVMADPSKSKDEAEPVIGIATVQNIKASDAVKLLNRLSNSKPVQAYSMGNSNSLIIASTASYYKHVLNMLKEIDVPDPVDGMLNVEQIIRRVCKQFNQQFVIDPTLNIRARVGVYLDDINRITDEKQRLDFFDAVLSGLNIQRIERDGIWFFSQSYPGMNGSGFGNNFVVETFELKNINARTALNTLKGMLNPHPVKGGEIKENNQLVVMVPREAVEGLRQAIAKLDRPKVPGKNSYISDVIAYFCAELDKPFIIAPLLNNHYRLNLRMPDLEHASKEEKLKTFDAILASMGVSRTERDGVWEFGTSASSAIVEDKMTTKLRASEPVIGVYNLKNIQGRMVHWMLSRMTDYPAKVYNVWGQQKILIITTAENYDKVAKVIESLDQQSSVIKSFPLHHSEAADVARELSNIFRYYMRTNYRPIEFVPIPRMNSVVVRNAKPEDLPVIEQWVEKLDNADNLDKRVSRVYHLQYEDAKNVAAVLSRLYRDVYRLVERQKKEYQISTRPGEKNLLEDYLKEQSKAESGSAEDAAAGDAQPVPAGNGAGGDEEQAVSGASETVILADTNTNSVVVNATMSTHRDIERLIKNLDGKRKQVLIEVTVVEVTLDSTTKHGIEWIFKAPQGKKVNSTGSFGYNKDFLQRYDSDWNAIPSGSDIFLAKDGLSYLIEASDQVMAALNVADNDDRVQVISSPSVLAREDKTATVSFGEEVPIKTTTMNDSVTEFSYNYRDAKIKLEVTPHINDGGIVTLELKQEMNSLNRASYEATPEAPIFNTRKVESEFQIADNQTLVLGGLIERGKSDSDNGIIFLKKIPVVKYFTSNQTKIHYTKEIIIILTPRIVKSREQADCITRTYRDNIMSNDDKRNYPGMNFLGENKNSAEILSDDL